MKSDPKIFLDLIGRLFYVPGRIKNWTIYPEDVIYVKFANNKYPGSPHVTLCGRASPKGPINLIRSNPGLYDYIINNATILVDESKLCVVPEIFFLAFNSNSMVRINTDLFDDWKGIREPNLSTLMMLKLTYPELFRTISFQ